MNVRLCGDVSLRPLLLTGKLRHEEGEAGGEGRHTRVCPRPGPQGRPGPGRLRRVRPALRPPAGGGSPAGRRLPLRGLR